jgi:peroxiredoxin
MKRILFIAVTVFSYIFAYSQGYKVGDKADDFKLKNVNGKMVSLSDYSKAKGFVVIFTCNHCPYAKAYQNRIIDIDKKYKELGYPVIAISSNDPAIVPDDSFEKMIELAKEKKITFPYVFDETQVVGHKFGALKTPHVYLLQKNNNELIVRYIGAIDDNYQEPEKVTSTFLANAIDALLANKVPNPDFTKAIGCSIKYK